MKYNLSIFLMILAVFITSCSEDEIATETNPEQQKEVAIIYKGVSYLTKTNDDSGLDKTKLNDEIINALNSAHIFDFGEENKVYLFDTDEELEAFSKSLKNNEIQAKIPVGTTSTSFFGDAYFRSNAREDIVNNFARAELRHYNNWHDIISSLHITNSLNTTFYVRLYEHKNYGGRTLTFSVPRHTVRFVTNLQHYNFNDITSGIRGWH